MIYMGAFVRHVLKVLDELRKKGGCKMDNLFKTKTEEELQLLNESR